MTAAAPSPARGALRKVRVAGIRSFDRRSTNEAPTYTTGLRCIPQPSGREAPSGAIQAAAVAAATAVSTLSLQETAMLELAVERASPKPTVELLGRCFMRWATAPGARRAAVVDIMYVRVHVYGRV